MKITEDAIVRGRSYEDLEKEQIEFIHKSDEYITLLTFSREEIGLMLENVGYESKFYKKVNEFYDNLISDIDELIEKVELNCSFVERHIPLNDLSKIYSNRNKVVMYINSCKKIIQKEIIKK